jgi:hypothetical protein
MCLVRHVYIDGTFSTVPVFRHPSQSTNHARRPLPETLEDALGSEEEDEDEEDRPARAKFTQLYD